MKWVNLFLVLVVVAGILGISGCTDNTASDVNRTTYGDYAERSTPNGVNPQWQVHLTKSSPFLDNATVDKVLEKIKPTSEDTEDGYTNIQTGTKTINGLTAYYKTYTTEDNDIEEEFYFEKNGEWYLIYWQDQQGNPNKSAIDSEIAYYMNKL